MQNQVMGIPGAFHGHEFWNADRVCLDVHDCQNHGACLISEERGVARQHLLKLRMEAEIYSLKLRVVALFQLKTGQNAGDFPERLELVQAGLKAENQRTQTLGMVS